MELENVKWSDDKFFKTRDSVLTHMHKKSFIPQDIDNSSNNFALKIKTAEQIKKTLIQSLVDCIDFGTTPVSDLYSVSGEVIAANKFKAPPNTCCQVILDQWDNKILMEYSLASGFTSFLGGWISRILFRPNIDNVLYYNDLQYCDRLAGHFAEKGQIINREFMLPEPGIIITPGFSNAVVLMEGILAAEQGVKSITLGYRGKGNFIQDTAAIIALREQAKEFLNYLGLDDVLVTVSFYMDKNDNITNTSAVSLSSYSAAVASAAGAVKTGITKPCLYESISAAAEVISMLEYQKIHYSKELELEITVIKLETKLIVDKLSRNGWKHLPEEIRKGIETGFLDVFSAEAIKLSDKSVRYLNFGNIPVNYQLKCYNKKKLKENVL